MSSSTCLRIAAIDPGRSALIFGTSFHSSIFTPARVELREIAVDRHDAARGLEIGRDDASRLERGDVEPSLVRNSATGSGTAWYGVSAATAIPTTSSPFSFAARLK